MKNGFLLINLGTPEKPDTHAVRRYLIEFLSDKRVIDLPAPLRYALVYGLIAPFRPKQSAQAYQAIWTEQGSPLLFHSQNLLAKLKQRFDPQYYQVALGMRYGKPSIQKALDELKDCEKITILPLYPQYSSAATGSSIEKCFDVLSSQSILPSLSIIRDFYQHPAFIKAQAELIRPYLAEADHVLFSYHGLPERHLTKTGCQPICSNACKPASTAKKTCYRAQCYETTDLLAQTLDLKPHQYSLAFQSRLGKTPWIKPYLDEILPKLVQKDIKRLVVACPSFVADCLETLEEIGIRAKEQWIEAGGSDLKLVPCLNDNDNWVKGVCEIAGINKPESTV